MPDLVTHIAVSHICRRPAERAGYVSSAMPFRIIFYLGTILPDILTRPFMILLPGTHDWVIIFHTPAGFFASCMLVTLMFEQRLRVRIQRNLLAGGAVHFLLDSIQKQVIGNDFWLFPFSWRSFGYELFWAHEIMYCLPLLAGLILAMELFYYFKKKSN